MDLEQSQKTVTESASRCLKSSTLSPGGPVPRAGLHPTSPHLRRCRRPRRGPLGPHPLCDFVPAKAHRTVPLPSAHCGPARVLPFTPAGPNLDIALAGSALTPPHPTRRLERPCWTFSRSWPPGLILGLHPASWAGSPPEGAAVFSLWPQAGLREALTARVSICRAASGEILFLPPPRTTHDTPERLCGLGPARCPL